MFGLSEKEKQMNFSYFF